MYEGGTMKKLVADNSGIAIPKPIILIYYRKIQFMKITIVTLDDRTLVTAFLNNHHLLLREFTITLKSVAYKAYPLKYPNPQDGQYICLILI